MTARHAVASFAALSHPVRLALFRELCARAPGSVPAGELADGFDVPPSTMTGHLQALERAGLIRAERRSRFMLYSLDTTGARELVQFLLQDCFDKQAEICDPDFQSEDPNSLQAVS